MQDQRKLKELMDNLTGFVDAKLELIKFDIKQDLSKVIINMLYSIFILLLVSIIFFLLSFGFAEYLNHAYESLYIGYLILASFYASLLLLIILLRKYTNLTVKLQKYILHLLDMNENDN